MILAMIDWTTVLASAIPTIPATLALLIGASNRRSLRTPSGDSIGTVVERTHDMAAVATLAVGLVEPTEQVRDSARRLNASGHSPVKVNGEKIPPTEETGHSEAG